MRSAIIRLNSGTLHRINFGYDHTMREVYKKIVTPRFLDGTTPYNIAHGSDKMNCVYRTDQVSEIYFGDWEVSDEDLATDGGLYLD